MCVNYSKDHAAICAAGVISERQIITIKSRLNRGIDAWPVLSSGPLSITPEQTEKGINWLLNQYKTPAGRVRKNNPFNAWAASILENFDRFQLVDFVDISRCPGWVSFYLPVYRVIDSRGRFFDYFCNYCEKGSPVHFV